MKQNIGATKTTNEILENKRVLFNLGSSIVNSEFLSSFPVLFLPYQTGQLHSSSFNIINPLTLKLLTSFYDFHRRMLMMGMLQELNSL